MLLPCKAALLWQQQRWGHGTETAEPTKLFIGNVFQPLDWTPASRMPQLWSRFLLIHNIWCHAGPQEYLLWSITDQGSVLSLYDVGMIWKWELSGGTLLRKTPTLSSGSLGFQTFFRNTFLHGQRGQHYLQWSGWNRIFKWCWHVLFLATALTSSALCLSTLPHPTRDLRMTPERRKVAGGITDFSVWDFGNSWYAFDLTLACLPDLEIIVTLIIVSP